MTTPTNNNKPIVTPTPVNSPVASAAPKPMLRRTHSCIDDQTWQEIRINQLRDKQIENWELLVKPHVNAYMKKQEDKK